MHVRSLPDELTYALVEANNQRMADQAAASFAHADRTPATDSAGLDYKAPARSPLQVTAAAATNEATSVTLANDIKEVLNRHYADAVAHDTAVSAALTTADATNAATAITLANAIKASLNTHNTEADVHYND